MYFNWLIEIHTLLSVSSAFVRPKMQLCLALHVVIDLHESDPVIMFIHAFMYQQRGYGTPVFTSRETPRGFIP